MRGAVTMTKAMYNKFCKAVTDFQSEMPGYYVHDCKFRHYGKTYRIEEDENGFKIFEVNSNDIYDTLIETVAK